MAAKFLSHQQKRPEPPLQFRSHKWIRHLPVGSQTPSRTALIAACKLHMPAYMVPMQIELRAGPLPRNANGKIDRRTLSDALAQGAAA